MRSVICAIAVCAGLAACAPLSSSRSEAPPAQAMKTTIEHVVVDDAVIDRKDPYEVIDPVWWTADIYEDERRYNETLAGFSREQRYVFAVAWHLAEVNNGGHEQFYSNSTGIVWKDALAGYREIGLAAAASLLEESAARMGGNPSLDRETRQRQLDSLEPDFEDLDRRFYELQEKVKFDDAMMKYIVSRREKFYFDGDVRMPTKPLP